MKNQNAGVIVATLATIALAGCDGVVTDQDSSEHPPLVELPSPTMASRLTDLASYYRDRERLLARDDAAAALARSWGRGMTVDEALEHADEAIAFLLWTYHAMRWSADPDFRGMSWGDAKAGIAEAIVESYENVTVGEIERDIERIEGLEQIKGLYDPLDLSLISGAASQSGCSGDVRLIRAWTHAGVFIHTTQVPWIFEFFANATQRATNEANHLVSVAGEITGDIGYSFLDTDGHYACRDRHSGAGHHKLWAMDRVVSFCAEAQGDHYVYTDDGSDNDVSHSYRICDTVTPPGGDPDPGDPVVPETKTAEGGKGALGKSVYRPT